jgi:hypothetical protein
MMTVDFKVNGRRIAGISLLNLAEDENGMSDYRVLVDHNGKTRHIRISGHKRSAGMWPLIERIAKEMQKK